MGIGATSRLQALAIAVLAGVANAEGPPAIAGPAEPTGGGRWPVELGAALDSVGFVPGVSHPLLSVGTEIPWDDRGRFRLAQVIQADYRVQPQFLHGPGLSTRLIARFVSDLGIFGEAGLGGGAMLAWFGARTFTLNPQTGLYEEGGNRARVLFKVGLGVGVGVDFSVRWKVPLRVTASYDEMLLLNVAPEAGFPLVPAAVVGLRLAWFLGGTP